MKYLRFLRDKESVIDVRSDVLVSSAMEAAAYLDGQEGAIFLTTGSKELPAFTAGVHKTERLFVRVLPSAAVVASCRELGLEGKQICAMQGPFSEEMNRALLQQTKAAWLVTKGYRHHRRFSGKSACGAFAFGVVAAGDHSQTGRERT